MTGAVSGGRGERFAGAMTAVVRRLPFGLARVVPPSLLGFAVINGFTFGCDLTLLTAFHGGLHWPVPVSITLSYGAASGLAYLLNRIFNFRSHAPVGGQFAVYAAVVAVNYLAWILGVGAGLAALGVNYQLARVMAGVCEAVYTYCAMRWLVFRDRPGGKGGDGGQSGDADDRVSRPGRAREAADLAGSQHEAQVSGRRYGGGRSAADLWPDSAERLAQQGEEEHRGAGRCQRKPG